jgi:hypothetical protein
MYTIIPLCDFMAGYRVNLTFYNSNRNRLSGNAQTEGGMKQYHFLLPLLHPFVTEVSFGLVCMEANTPTTLTFRQKFGKMF